MLKAAKKYSVVVAISLNVDSYLEVVEYDTIQKKVLKYENTVVSYNKNERKIDEPEALEEALREIFTHMTIMPGTPIFVSLPDIYISQRLLSARMSETQIETEIKQDLVNTNLFDDVNPVARWKQLTVDEDEDTQTVLYSGMKEDIVELFKNVITGLGMELIAIDNSSFSLIKGVIGTGFITEDDLDIIGSEGWAILSLTQDQYEMIALTGKSITSLTQESLSYDGTVGIYNKIADVIMPAVESLWISNMVIVNTVPGISSQELANRMALDFPVHCLDINENATAPVYDIDEETVDADKALNISPYVVGTALYQDYFELGFDFAFDNVKLQISAGGLLDVVNNLLEGRETRKFIMSISPIVCGILILLAIGTGLFYFLQQGELQRLNAEKSDLEIQLKNIKPRNTNEFDATLSIKKLYEKDKDISKSLALVSDVIPDNLWIKEFNIYSDLSVYMRGYSYNVPDIIEFYKALKTFSKFKDLTITQILIAGEGRDSTNSNIDYETGEDDMGANTSAPTEQASADPSALPTLPGLEGEGGVTAAPSIGEQITNINDIPNEPCYEFIIGNKK